jgi:hypothetical protein
MPDWGDWPGYAKSENGGTNVTTVSFGAFSTVALDRNCRQLILRQLRNCSNAQVSSPGPQADIGAEAQTTIW